MTDHSTDAGKKAYKWKEFNEAVDRLDRLLKLKKLSNSPWVLYAAHNVLGLLAEMPGVYFLSYCFSGKYLIWEDEAFIRHSFLGEFPQATLAAAKSEELTSWRKGQ